MQEINFKFAVMFKSLYFKIVLILLIFIIAVMCSVGAILLSGVTSYYLEDFAAQMTDCFDEDGLLMMELCQAAEKDYPALEMKNVLSSYSSVLGIDKYRNYYVLNLEGEMLSGSDITLGSSLKITPNLLTAISGNGENTSSGGMDSSDWAVRISMERSGAEDVIVYIIDSLGEMRQLNGVLYKIVFQAMLIGIFIAVLLSFFLAKSISSPIQSLTYGTQLVASGEFSNEIAVSSEDEIGVLAENFNYMRERLRTTLEEVDGEREKLETVLSCLRDPVVAFTQDGKVLHSNNSAQSVFKVGMNELTIEKCFELLDIPLSSEGGKLKLLSTDAEAESTKDGYIFRDRIFADRVYDVSCALFRYTENKKTASGCVIIIHDVTGRFELDESRREFVANVSHELRTPLTAIKGAVETVRMDPEIDAADRDYFLDMALSESDRMKRIVDDLLVLSRLDNKRTKWNIEKFDIRQSVRRLCDVMRSDLEAHRHRLTFGCDKNLPEITADRQRIEQVVINIMSNAIKYTPDGGQIDIRITKSQRKSVLISVADNGIGIPDEDISHLFERFYRVEKSRNQDAGGTGLGLAIAKELVEAHGGQITVESELGSGTNVTIELPIECRIRTDEKQSGNGVNKVSR
ncbi:MAG: ATP-binding protein [Eubacteriales bacterium]